MNEERDIYLNIPPYLREVNIIGLAGLTKKAEEANEYTLRDLCLLELKRRDEYHLTH